MKRPLIKKNSLFIEEKIAKKKPKRKEKSILIFLNRSKKERTYIYFFLFSGILKI
jgi:hypothetical protein